MNLKKFLSCSKYDLRELLGTQRVVLSYRYRDYRTGSVSTSRTNLLLNPWDDKRGWTYSTVDGHGKRFSLSQYTLERMIVTGVRISHRRLQLKTPPMSPPMSPFLLVEAEIS